MSYTQKVLDELKARYPEQPEFIQAATEILGTIQPALDAHPEYEEAALLERLVEPERIVMFRVPWVDDQGKVRSTAAIASSSTLPLDPTRAACALTRRSPWACSSSWAWSRSSRTA